MESTTDNSYASGSLQAKQDRIQCICDHIDRSNEELKRINEKLGAKEPLGRVPVFRISGVA